MTGSIREIAAFSDETVPQDDEEIRKALSIACAPEFIGKLPKGLDTQIREKGLGLSEGQVQRLAIARAIYTGRPILLLDEDTGQKLLEHLKALTDRTVLIVTHRPAALSICGSEVHIDTDSVKCRKLNNEAKRKKTAISFLEIAAAESIAYVITWTGLSSITDFPKKVFEKCFLSSASITGSICAHC